MTLTDKIKSKFKEHITVATLTEELAPVIEDMAKTIIATLDAGGKVLFCGNGGSAADSQHLTAEFTGRFMKERRPLPAISLNVNVSGITAIGNDYGFEYVFSRELQALGNEGDVLFALSTSGNSNNIIEAAQKARDIGIKVLGLTGKSGGKLAKYADHILMIPSDQTPRIQEMHITAGHIICGLVEDAIC